MPRLLVLFCLLPFLGHAAPATSWQAAAIDAALWDDPHWHNLMHYEPAGWASGVESQVDGAAFFLAPNGKRDPRAELLATIEALLGPITEAGTHPQCRFMARRQWLGEQLPGFGAALPEIDCPEYAQWREQLGAERVTLIFPAYYLNSPSSMFGHTLLRLDPADGPDWSEWLSFAVNFGAEVNPDDNSLFYALKGLAGGYSGQFAVEPYYRKIKEYNQIDNRDIWEYPLNLSPAETDRMVRHLWELRDIDFAYFFFDENCSYRVLELLEVARPGIDLTSGFTISAIPVDTVRAVLAADLVRGSHFRPSKARELERRLARLPAGRRAQVLALQADPGRLDSPAFQALPPSVQAQLVEAAYTHLRYTQTGRPRDKDAAARSFALLGAMRAHADNLPAADPPPPPAPPEASHASRRASLGFLQRDEQRHATLALRLAFHSLEEYAQGFLPGAQINLGQLTLRSDPRQAVKLERLDLVDIFSLSPRDEFFRPWSWRIRTGLERQPTGARDELVAHVDGGAGQAWSPWSGNLSYMLVTARAEYNRGFRQHWMPAMGIALGSLQRAGRIGLRVEAGSEKFANGQTRHRLEARQQVQLGGRQALALRGAYHWRRPLRYGEFGLRYHFYF